MRPVTAWMTDEDRIPDGDQMTLLRPGGDWMLRLACVVIWYALSLGICVEIGALLGWAFGAPGLGARIAILPHGLWFLWLLRADCAGDRH